MRSRCRFCILWLLFVNVTFSLLYIFMTSYGGISQWTHFIGRNLLRRDLRKLRGTAGCKSSSSTSEQTPLAHEDVVHGILSSIHALSRCQQLILERGKVNLTSLAARGQSSYHYFSQAVNNPVLMDSGCSIQDVFPSTLASKSAQVAEHCFTEVFSHSRMQETYHALYKIVERFQRENIEYILDSGSVIGSWRHHGPIPYDDDIDIRIWREDKPRVRHILESLADEPSNRMLFKDTEWENQHWKLGYMCHLSGYNDTSLSKCDIQIDIFFNWICPDETHMCFLEPPRRYPLSMVYPLQRRPFAGLMLTTYRDVESYMRLTYSVDMSWCKYYTHSQSRCLEPTIPCSALNDRYVHIERVPLHLVNLTSSSSSVLSVDSSSVITSAPPSKLSDSTPILGFLEYLIDVDKVIAVYFDCHWFCNEDLF